LTPKRTIIVVAAIVIALIAGGLTYVFLHNAQTNAFNNAKLVPAYVVEKPIPRGTAGADAVNGKYFAQKSIPAEVRPSTAVTDLNAIGGKTAIADFPVGQILVDGMFVSPSAAVQTFSQVIPAGDVAVTVSVDSVHGVANLPQPGDNVDILITQNGSESFLLQNVKILAIGQSTAGSTTTAGTTTATTTANNGSGLFTFAANPTNAERIALAQQANLGIYLLLVPPNNPVVSIQPFNPGNILSGPPS
jgi:pilus assembly protein CpaB